MSADGGRAFRAARAWTLAAFASLAVLFSGTFPPFSNPNELSRYEAVVAAADYGTLAIDPVLPVLGDHEDKSVAFGRTYSNKAPGLALAAIPVYRFLRVALGPPSGPAAPIFWLLRALTVSLLCVVALARLFRRLAAQGAGNPAATALVVVAVAFGTPLLFFARTFFSHAWTAALLFLSWDALRATEDESGSRRGGALAALAGLLAGWAAISEYAVAPVAVLLAARAAAGGRWRRVAAFALGAAFPLALLGAYDAVCFGSPWVLSSAREAYPDYSRLAGSGLFGFGRPRARVALDYLLHPARGVLLFSPFLLWTVPGFVRWWRSRAGRADCAFALAATAVYFVLMCGYPNWHGGWSLGNRYLIPVVFFPALALIHALASPLSRGLFAAAAVFSVATHVLLTATWPYFPANVPWPPATGSEWFLARGWVAPSLGRGIPGGGWAAPILAALAAGAALALSLRAAAPLSPRPGVAVLLGLAPLAVSLLRPPQLDFGGRLWRAAIYGAYSGRDPARSELREVADSASTPRERQMAAGAWRAYGPR